MSGESLNSTPNNTGAANTSEWDSLLGRAQNIHDNLQDDLEHIDHKLAHQFGYNEADAARDRASRQAVHDQDIQTREEYINWLDQNQNRTAAEADNDFSGEQNLNSKTGKERTFTDRDVYPINSQDKTSREYGDRIIRNNDLTVLTEYLPKDQDETTEEYSKRITGIYEQFPRAEGEELAQYKERIQGAYDDNSLFEALANQTIAPDSALGQKLQDDYANIEDMRKGGRFDEARAEELRREVTAHALEEQRKLDRQEAKLQHQAELKEKLAAKKAAEAEPEGEPEGLVLGEGQVPSFAELNTPEEKAKLEAEEKAALEAAEKAELEGSEKAELESAEKAGLESSEKDDLAAAESAETEPNGQNPEEITLLEQEEAQLQQIESGQEKVEKELLAREEELDDQVRAKLQEIANASLEPLVAINADFTHDKKELAHDFAEQELNEELSHAGFIKRIWKGTLFKKYYQKKYEKEIFEGREFDYQGEQVDLDDIVERRSNSAIQRFVLGVTDDYGRAIHTEAGESIAEADAHTTEVVKSAIEWFAGATIPEGGSLQDLMVEFGNRIKLIQAEGRDQDDQSLDDKLINNYYEVAVQARERAEHGAAIDRVMEGFKVYNADVRNNVRSEAHRDNIDKIVNRIESSAIGQVIPAEVVAAAVGAAWGLTQTGARAVAGPIAGIGVSGIAAGLRERNRVTEDRTRMMRDAAAGYEYEGTAAEASGERPEGKRAKYEARIGGTLYDTRPASELISNLTTAMESNNKVNIIQAIAEARVRVDYSDSEQKDLITYSSADKLGDERLQLDIALIRAEKSLSEEDQAGLKIARDAIQQNIEEDVDEKDQDFRKLRTAQALKQAGKTIAIGSVAFFGSQEIMAAVSPTKIGLLEKLDIIHTENNADASETILAGLAGPRIRTDIIDNVSGDDLESIQRYKDAGYEQVEVDPAWTETKKDLIDVRPTESTHRIKAAYDGWANNGTPRIYEGNELGIHLQDNAFVSNMTGNSTMGSQNFNYNSLLDAGHVKGYITIGGAKFEVASTINSSGQLTWPIDANGAITTTTGETIKAIGGNGEKLYQYFEVALDNGTDASGFTHIMPFATDVGANTFDGTIQQVTETIVEHPANYSFLKDIPRDIYYGGVILPGGARTGIGGVNAPASANNPANNPETSPEAAA